MKKLLCLLPLLFVTSPAWARCPKVKHTATADEAVLPLGPAAYVVAIHQDTPSVGPDGTTADTWFDLRFTTGSTAPSLPLHHTFVLTLGDGEVVSLPVVQIFHPTVSGVTTGSRYSSVTQLQTHYRAVYTIGPEAAAHLGGSPIVSARLVGADGGLLAGLPVDTTKTESGPATFQCVVG